MPKHRTLRATSASGDWNERFFTGERRIDRIRGPRPGTLRRRTDYAYARTRQAPSVAGGLRKLHLFVVELSYDSIVVPGDWDAPDYDPFPDTSASRPEHLDRIRYGVLNMSFEGELWAGGERPVRLADTKIVSP